MQYECHFIGSHIAQVHGRWLVLSAIKVMLAHPFQALCLGQQQPFSASSEVTSAPHCIRSQTGAIWDLDPATLHNTIPRSWPISVSPTRCKMHTPKSKGTRYIYCCRGKTDHAGRKNNQQYYATFCTLNIPRAIILFSNLPPPPSFLLPLLYPTV